jgi:hypothetical protein
MKLKRTGPLVKRQQAGIPTAPKTAQGWAIGGKGCCDEEIIKKVCITLDGNRREATRRATFAEE